MEAGTDFDTADGLSLRSGGEQVRIRPLPDRDALFISSGSPQLAREYEALARALDVQP